MLETITVSLLPVSLSLVHIPRPRLPALSHPILRQILQPNPIFLNITCNEIELSLFAEQHVLHDFEHIARRDRQKLHSRSTSKARKSTLPLDFEPIEISYEKWRVLQIDSHSDQIDDSGARVHDLSAPLAAAGISILYQSSYLSDFIFVKESRLQEAMNLFASAGFHLYSSESSLMTNSPSLSPTSVEHSPVIDIGSVSASTSGAVLTRSRSSTDTSMTALTSRISSSCTLESKESSPGTQDDISQSVQTSLRQKSHSPTASEVRLLRPDLACVGLSEDFGVDHWGLKIVKLVAFPDLIPTSPKRNYSSEKHADNTINGSLPVLEEATSVILSGRPSDTGSDSSSSSSDDDDDGYFSHSPLHNTSTSSLMTSASRSYTDLLSSTTISHFKPSSKHYMSSISPLSPLYPKLTHPAPNLSLMTDAIRSTSAQEPEFPVPFFSFTRTQEGSSLTADVDVLAALFPQHERHMVICSGELDAADERVKDFDSSDDYDDNDDATINNSTLKCLQIDLRRFGLDKHGLVNRFSRVLEENGINHMYSSTFKTANLLVDKRHAVRAQSLLRLC
ncbi:hypothetical protein BDQ17DRAFT_1352034 [Cyathus striatus]|nr:hypothetical protein BDQ17DRAFT_1352034 [Cyathus striatus]